MSELEFQQEISDYEGLFNAFEALVRDRDKFFVTDDRLATALCELYAIMGAYQILACMRSTNEFKIVPVCEENENQFAACGSLPKHETVQKAGRELLSAVALGNRTAVSGALKKMGVLALCPVTGNILPKMEVIAGRVAGDAQQVFLTELARFAGKVGDYERASKYVRQARTFDPSSWELYNICVVEGLIALNAGVVDEAVQWMARSVGACLAYEQARVQCCIRAPNLELAEKLLECGERGAVLKHLSDCRNVWEVLQPQIDNWIKVLDSGGKPDFRATGGLRVPETPSHRLRMQWMNACSLAEGPVSSATRATPPKSAEERLAWRDQWLAENVHLLDPLIKRELAYLEKDLAPSDHRVPNQADPDQTE